MWRRLGGLPQLGFATLVLVAGHVPARGVFRVNLRRRSRGRVAPYAAGEIEFVVAVCPAAAGPEMYVIPAWAFAGRSSAPPAPTAPAVVRPAFSDPLFLRVRRAACRISWLSTRLPHGPATMTR